MEYMLIQGLFLRQFHLSFLFILFSLTLNTHAAVPGVTAGEFSVDASGGANYSVPIAVPPGTSGMQPSLSLSYNSRSGNGMLGVGFTLGGLSVITRCPANKVIDGFIDGVDFDDNDRFCIDGQRLIAVTGTYGSNGTEYRTELDGFTKVLSYGSTGNGPEKFLAYTKSGQILKYGYTTDSQIEAEGKTDIRLWAVNKISDTVGNYLTITYTEANTNGTYKPTRIDYTGNTAEGLSPYAKVEFEYETRTDITPLYFAGSLIKNTERVTNIKTYVDNNLVRDYQLTYDNAGAADRSRLTHLTECDGQTTPTCFKPIEFEWQQKNSGYTEDPNYALPDHILYRTSGKEELFWGQFVDVNGDGLVDRVKAYSAGGVNYTTTWINTGSGWQEDPNYALPDIILYRVNSTEHLSWGEFVDVNGDGLVDRVKAYSAGGVNYRTTWINTGSGWQEDPNYALPDIILYRVNSTEHLSWGEFVDVNGDGLVDRVKAYSAGGVNYRTTWINTGSGWQEDPNYALPDIILYRVNSTEQLSWGEFVDVNGDGLVDRVKAYSASGVNYWTTWINTGSGWQEDPNYALPDIILYRVNSTEQLSWGEFVDVNGDGLVDRVKAYSASGVNYWTTWINTGSGWQEDPNYALPDIILYRVNSTEQLSWGEFVDVNGDGLVDRVKAYSASGVNYWTTWINTGSGWQEDPNYALPDSILYRTSDKYHLRWGKFVDVNGDGLLDRVKAFRGHDGSETQDTFIANSSSPDLLITVTSSLGTSTEITYTPITDTSIYTKGSGATYPEIDIQEPVYVVSSVKSDSDYVANGSLIPSQRETTYTYSGAKFSYLRGFLGFNTMSSTDVDTGMRATTTYKQIHPYTGMVKLTEQHYDNGTPADTSDDVLLGEVDTTFDFTQTHTGTETDASHPGVLFPYAATVTKKEYEMQ